MVTVYFKEAIDESQELEFSEANNAYISDDYKYLVLTAQEEDEIMPRIVGRFYSCHILGYYIDN